MTPIAAKVVSVDRQGNRYRIIVQTHGVKYRGSFNTLVFGENKPTVGSFRDGRLKLIYYRNPGVKEGDTFPLWTIQ
jgi:hypothetical protein